MENQNNNETFTYTYSATQQEEIQEIRKRYLPEEEEVDKMELLRRLDRSVTQKGTIFSLLLGIFGALVMGLGMCCVMVWKGVLFIPGIIIGVVGIAVAALAYPVYINVVRKERERVTPEIIKLTDELLK